MRAIRAAVAGLALLAPAGALAQASACAIPAAIPQPLLEGPTREQPRRIVPVTGYSLALSWSPEYCRGKATSPRDRIQCGGVAGQFGFTLHGLWPDGAGGTWPQYCRPTRLVPERVLRAGLCETPSVQLMQHEWEKHGTCMAASPDAYFRTARRLYRALRFPDMAALARRERVTAGEFAQAFGAANRGVTAEMVRVSVSRAGWLDEIALCLDRRLRPTRCGAGGAARGTALRIAPPG